MQDDVQRKPQSRPILTRPKKRDQAIANEILAVQLPSETKDVSREEFTRLCAPLIGAKIVAVHKAGFRFHGTLSEVTHHALSISNAVMVSKARTLRNLSLVVIRCSVLSHVNADGGPPA